MQIISISQLENYSPPFIKTKILTTIKANTMIPIDENTTLFE